ncbi:penicillin acylase family protein [Amaricoccus macauensis]|uniref:penicillin acylase family protein n=1 Tax=Amaricoccus macauensis TaxID=57001 RepID=UPI003C7ED2D3
MAFLFRWFMRAFIFLTVLVIIAAGLAYYLAEQSLPDYNKEYLVSGPTGEVEIIRDRYGVPHILAESDHDALFGLGFVHAQDRLWQMFIMRRAAQGRLSELFGPGTLEIDQLMRALDIYGSSREAAAIQSSEITADLNAYADGVNAWLRIVQRDALGRGAPELFLFDSAIAPWIPADSIAIQKLMGLRLSDNAARETLRARLSLRIPAERVRDILPEETSQPVMGLPEFSEMFPDLREGPVEPPVRHALYPLAPVGQAGASNAFAAAADRTAAGVPLLANDPHLALTAPTAFYLARLDLESGPAIGATLPGVPSIVIGRNENIGWGLTASYLDNQDIYIERLDPEDPDRYLTPEGYEPFRQRDAVINVRGEDPVHMVLKWTRHGPVIPGNHFEVEPITPQGHVAALAWTGLTSEDRSIEAAMGLMRAGSIREARNALRALVVPSQMITLADKETVALQMAGSAPRRHPGHTSRGRIPSPGWLAINDWQGIRPFSEYPWVIDPPSGIVANTNNRITDALWPDNLSHDWGDTFRIVRAARLLGAREYHTLDSFIEIQTDTISEPARTLLPLIARDLWYSDAAAEEGSAARRRQDALERLADWNGAMSEHDPEPLIYAAWMRALQRRLIIDELGTYAELLPQPEPVFIERVFRNVDGAGDWCDVAQTSVVETCSDMASRALDDALVELTEEYGGRVESWRWGDAHQAVHRHETLGTIPVLGLLTNIRQTTGGGDHTLMRGLATGRAPEPFLNEHASVLRTVYDFADPDSSVIILSTGQSGHPLSRHYDDMSTLWRRGEYIPMSLDTDLARAAGDGVTHLVPQE